MAEDLPRITIVTPSYNQAAFLEQTILSVLEQDYPNLQYMVIDGGSTDGSVDIMRRYEDHLDLWVSEPDQGQYDALRKGFAQATGELLGWLNSDDVYLKEALSTVGQGYTENPGSCIAGPVVNVDMGSGKERLIPQFGITFENMVKFWEQRYSWHQPGLFFPRAAYEAVGGVDGTLDYAMDHDLICRLLQHCQVVYVDQPIARFRLHSTSKTCTAWDQYLLELSRVSQRYWCMVESVDRGQHDQHLAERFAVLAAANLPRQPVESARLFAYSLRLSPTAALRVGHRVTKRWLRERRVRDSA